MKKHRKTHLLLQEVGELLVKDPLHMMVVMTMIVILQIQVHPRPARVAPRGSPGAAPGHGVTDLVPAVVVLFLLQAEAGHAPQVQPPVLKQLGPRQRLVQTPARSSGGGARLTREIHGCCRGRGSGFGRRYSGSGGLWKIKSRTHPELHQNFIHGFHAIILPPVCSELLWLLS